MKRSAAFWLSVFLGDLHRFLRLGIEICVAYLLRVEFYFAGDSRQNGTTCSKLQVPNFRNL